MRVGGRHRTELALVRIRARCFTALMLLGMSGCGMANSANDADTGFGSICDELEELDAQPLSWVAPDGRLTLSQGDAGALVMAFGVGAAANGPRSAQGTIRDLLSRRLDGSSKQMSAREEEALGRLQVWSDQNCSVSAPLP